MAPVGKKWDTVRRPSKKSNSSHCKLVAFEAYSITELPKIWGNWSKIYRRGSHLSGSGMASAPRAGGGACSQPLPQYKVWAAVLLGNFKSATRPRVPNDEAPDCCVGRNSISLGQHSAERGWRDQKSGQVTAVIQRPGRGSQALGQPAPVAGLVFRDSPGPSGAPGVWCGV